MAIETKEMIFEGPKQTLQKMTTTYGKYILERTARFGDAKAQVDPTTLDSITFKELCQRSINTALELQRLGLKVGDKVMLCMRNSLDVLPLYYGTLAVGATITPIHPDHSSDDSKTVIDMMHPSFLFCNRDYKDKMLSIFREFNITCQTFVVEDDVEQFIKDKSSVLATLDDIKVDNFDAEENFALILCSSGTTGVSKGITITHQAMHYSTQTATASEVTDSNFLHFSSIFWASSHMVNNICLTSGITLILGVTCTPEAIMQTIERCKIKAVFLTPTYLDNILKHPDRSKYDLSSLFVIALGGNITPAAKMIEYRNTLKKVLVYSTYGLTETMCGVGKFEMNKAGLELLDAKPGSVGPIATNVKVKIMDIQTNKCLGKNSPGEIVVKVPSQTKGYYQNAKATAKAIDKDGWFHTGDMGYMDDDACLYVLGRKSDILIFNGKKVPLAEIEIVVAKHPAVKACTLIGIPWKDQGEVPKAFVVKEPGVTVDEKEIIDFVDSRVNDFQKLRGGLIFVDDIPTTPSGKVQKYRFQKYL